MDLKFNLKRVLHFCHIVNYYICHFWKSLKNVLNKALVHVSFILSMTWWISVKEMNRWALILPNWRFYGKSCLILKFIAPLVLCTYDGAKYIDHTMMFLMGLQEKYAQVRGQILLMDSIHTINWIFSLLIQEERQIEIHQR